MKTMRKLAAIFAVIILSLSLFCTVVYADETTETADDFVVGTLPPGTGTVVDVFADKDGRQFYTIQTPAGNTFYLIIDTSKLSENVYFLDAVNERDLIALSEKATVSSESVILSTAPSGKQGVEQKPVNQTEPEAQPKNNTQNFIMFGVLFVVLAVGGGVYFMKSRKTKKNNDSRAEYEDEDEYIPDEDETEPEDEAPQWEDEE